MSEQNKQEWTKKFFSDTDMKEFAEIGKKYTPEAMKDYQDRWTALIDEVKAKLETDPESPDAQELARRWDALFAEGYGGHPELSRKIGQAYQEAWKTGATFGGHMPYGPEVMEFIAKARQAAGRPCPTAAK